MTATGACDDANLSSGDGCNTLCQIESLGVWITGAAMNDQGELWVTVFDTYERNQNTPIRIARVDPNLGVFVSEPTTLSEGGDLLHAYSIHGSDIAFRSDGAMVLSANAAAIDPDLNYPGSRYLEIDPDGERARSRRGSQRRRAGRARVRR